MEKDNNNSGVRFITMATFFALGAVTMMLCSRRTRQKACRWTDEMREEVMRQTRETKDITQEKYNQIVDDIRYRYETMKDVSSREMSGLINELKAHWKNISQEVKSEINNSGQKHE
jgi:uncharacterized protein YoxC